MDFIYQQQILDHYKNPRHAGELTGVVPVCLENVTCGDKLCMYRQDGQYSFTGSGCAISQAAASMLLEKITQEQLSPEQIRALSVEDMRAVLKIPLSANRLKCGLLALEAVQQLVAKHT